MSKLVLSERAQTVSKAVSCVYGVLLVAVAAPSHAALSLSDAPLFLTVGVPPNIVLTVDDSGSMRRAFVPENCLADTSDCDLLDNRYEKAANRNLIYYNPKVTYPAPKTATGTSLTTSFTNAYRNGFDTAFGTVNLSSNYKPTANLDLDAGTATEVLMGHYSGDVQCDTDSASSTKYCEYRDPTASGGWTLTTTTCSQITGSSGGLSQQQRRNNFCAGSHGTTTGTTANVPVGVPAYYYVFDSTNSSCTGAEADNTDNDCYDIVKVSATSGPGGTDERQNFANWYSFARTRNLATQTSISLAFASVPSNVRVAWQALNSCRGSATNLVDTDCDGWKDNFSGISNAIKPFTGTHKTNFYSWIFQQPTNGGTGLPEAMKRAGDYYRTSGENSPYDNDFTTGSSGELACRRNFHVMFTDGIWTTAASVGNADNTTTPLPVAVGDVTQYVPAAPYKDPTTNTLADVAFKYWVEDSRTGLENNLTASIKDSNSATLFSNPINDPATWQHMVNFTIGLGLTGYLADAGLTWDKDMFRGSYDNLKSGATSWPVASTTTNNPANVADLWHAAINSRGQFFSADDPASLSAAFQNSINAIVATAGSNSALASNSTSLNLNNTVVYQAKFNQDWSGTLLALPVSLSGAVGTAIWNAKDKLPAASARQIYTRNDSSNTGALFNSCSNLSAAQKLALDTSMTGVVDNLCTDRLNWLRGDTSKEVRNNGPFRNRTNGLIGDIIASNPAYVKAIDYGYSGMPTSVAGQSSYAGYVAANGSRTAMVYVGSNDGKLYGFDALSGVEKFSYIPGLLYANLSALTDPNYLHRYYVDGPITVGDAYLGGAWKTMLLGGLNGGGKSIYALDVTNPDGFNTTHVKWEFTDTNMGYSFSQPQIGVLQNGQWVAVFGNGYNSTSGGSYLYIVDLASGALLKKITASDPAGDESNGMSTPVLYDVNGDHLIDTIYAGDLLGNLWKFDVSGASSSWGVAFGGSPFFKARNGSGAIQPITAQPTVQPHPQPTATLVIFGTGRYLTSADLADTSIQSVYGLRDTGVGPITTTNRSELQPQTFTASGEVGKRKVRTVSSNSVDYGTQKGYYLDLTSTIAPGERVTSPLPVKRGRIIITSIVPNTDACSPGGTSFLTETSASGGGALGYCAIDIDGNRMVDAADKLGGVCSSSVELQVGLSTTALYLTSSEDADGDGLIDSGTGAGTAAAPDMKFHTGTNGSIVGTAQGTNGCTVNCGVTGGAQLKRRSWVQIR